MRSEVIQLYRSLLRVGRQFSDYNIREYSKRRTMDAFRDKKNLTDPRRPPLSPMVKLSWRWPRNKPSFIPSMLQRFGSLENRAIRIKGSYNMHTSRVIQVSEKYKERCNDNY
ncbi:uncharacterized protein LOC120171888 [Hibiscus syriacus]|uniref:uncharacterized protein LOC120171888 n=1 Tax=Hibiscus syriacus TaxID=106335 RepID=UPI0019213949|nr:uncharacterized protein LOC120171888 [Hibiscus syriacus]